MRLSVVVTAGAEGVSAFQMEVMRNLVNEAMEEMQDVIRRDVLNMHVEMLKQFQKQQVCHRSADHDGI